MALHPDFPSSPFAPLVPEQRWFPADEALRDTAYDKLLPPLVATIRREVDELAVFNDEAHHIHNPKMAWFKSIQDIHHSMVQKDRRLAIQIDVTAAPRHDNGCLFVQTVCDYPLVEAIHQNVVKHQVLPDAALSTGVQGPRRPRSGGAKREFQGI